jgi:hypothetical protein
MVRQAMDRQQGGQLQQTTGGPGKPMIPQNVQSMQMPIQGTTNPVGPQGGLMDRQRMMAQQLRGGMRGGGGGRGMRRPPNPTGYRGGGRGGPMGRRSMY